jgi:hypothetical protein
LGPYQALSELEDLETLEVVFFAAWTETWRRENAAREADFMRAAIVDAVSRL